MSSDRVWLIQQEKVWEIYGPCFWEKHDGEGRGSEDSTCLQQDTGGSASVASNNGESRGQVTHTFFVPAQVVA